MNLGSVSPVGKGSDRGEDTSAVLWVEEVYCGCKLRVRSQKAVLQKEAWQQVSGSWNPQRYRTL